ncbi:MAG: AbrB/MazE/SpoVT family DNA-binding domain-containing protein [Bacillota bacterium]
MTPKGQVTIPQFIRNKLGLRPGDKFVWELLDTGEMKVKRLDLLERGERLGARPNLSHIFARRCHGNGGVDIE